MKNFESDKISGSGTMIGGVYYFVVPEEERLRISNVLRESLDLSKVESLKHIETNETQITPDVEKHQPVSQPFYQEEAADEYVEPVQPAPVTPTTPTTPTTQQTTNVQNTTTIQKADDKKVETTTGVQKVQPTTVAPTKVESSTVEVAPAPTNTTIAPKPAAVEKSTSTNQP